MLDQKFLMTVETVRRLLHRHATVHIQKIFSKLHPADIARLLRRFPHADQQSLFNLVDDFKLAAQILRESDAQSVQEIVSHLEVKRIAQIVQAMDPDDAADFIGRLAPETAEEILQAMHRDDSAEVEQLLLYPSESAGGIMTTNVLALSEELTAGEAIAEVRRASEVEMVFYIYVVDEKGHLLGVTSLREIILAEPTAPLKSFMNPNVLSVTATTDQEEVAKLVRRYNLLAIPVVDEENKLLGMVTVDDVVDVIYEEATEDMLLMAGGPGEDLGTSSISTLVRKRAPWLLVSCVGGIVALQIISHYQASLNKLIALAAFIPIVMGMGGNVGGQSASIIIAGLAVGRIERKAVWQVIFREVRVGFILGFVYGAVVGVVANLQYAAAPLLGLTVGLSITGAMTLAATLASFIPLILSRLNIDPAFATAPFIQISMDIIGITIYFNLANFLMFR
ncbi:MAG: magnesium transporter [Candidatus Tectimicrobiota bacterium]